jgi:filamentous hemagglutinin
VLVAQSRIMTEQGGNIVMWISNGNLDAGEGAKTSVSAPPPLYKCDIDFRCSADIKGQVSGAGIATLQSLPGVPVGDANLMAPRGTINAGAAGLRVSGNLNLVALQVLNAFNIQTQGIVTGLPTYAGPSMATLTTASNVVAATQTLVPVPSGGNNNQPSVIIVEVIGYGGGAGNDNQPQQDQHQDDQRRNKTNDQRSYNTNSAFQIVGAGALTDDQKQELTQSERSKLGEP